MGGLHDFTFGGGALEIKSSAATTGFIARISSLDQLDDSTVAPLLLAAVRIAAGGMGRTLPEVVQQLRDELSGRGRAVTLLEQRLLHAGFSDRYADRYVRRFDHTDTRVFVVNRDFPRLVHGTVPPEIRRASYDIDLDMVNQPPISLGAALSLIGVR
jgi:hypothetical protein